MSKKNKFMVEGAMIATLYIVLLLVFKPISFSDVQIRIAEALTILPFFTPAAIPGLFLGCFLGNLLTGSMLIDVIFGSLTTLIAAVFSYMLRKYKYLVPLPPILANTIVVPFILRFAYSNPVPIPIMMVTVGIGEVLSCGVLGLILLLALNKHKDVIFNLT